MKLINRFVFSLIILSFFTGNLWGIYITQSVKITVLDLCVVMGFLGNIKRILQINWRKSPVIYFVLTGLVSLIFSLKLFNTSQVLIGSLYLFRFTIYSLFFASNVWQFKLYQTRSLIYLLGSILVITGLGQYLLFPDVRPMASLQWDPHYYRVVGTFLDPGYTSLLLVLFFFYLLNNPVKNIGLRWIAIVSTYLALALTYSRSGYLALLIGSAYLAWKSKGGKFFARIALLLACTIVFLPRSSDGEGVKLERSNSIWSRIHSWKTAIIIFSKHPVLGVGFNNYRYAQNKYGFLTDPKWQISHAGAGADSSLLFVAATTGIVGLGFYIKYLKSLYDLRSNNLDLQVALVATLTHGIFLNSLFYPAILVWIGLLASQTTGLKSR